MPAEPDEDDPQAEDVYSAERVAWRQVRHRAPSMSLAELARSANRVCDSRWWFSRFAPVAQPVRCRHLPPGCDWDASAGNGILYFRHKPSCRNELVLAHELAHLAAPGRPYHGPHFTRAYLDVMQFLCGDAAGRALREQLVRQRVAIGSRSPRRSLEALAA